MPRIKLPYFDYVFQELSRNNSSVERSFGRHVHWGYWENPDEAICDDGDYARAAERLTLELTALANIQPGQTILDAGCGFGGTIASLNERYENLNLIGLNIDMRQLSRAAELVKPQNANCIEFCQADACRLPFKNASLDCVLAVECIFHFPSREDFFREVYRVLKPGGVLALSDFVPSTLFMPGAILSSSRFMGSQGFFGQSDIRYSLGRYRSLAKRSGMEPVVERNITANTVPTYRYLKSLMNDSGAIAPRQIPAMDFISRAKLLNYYLLSYRKQS